MLNSCDFQGKVCGDPKYFVDDNEVARCVFTVRVERDRKNDDGRYESDFFDFLAWSSTADFVHTYFHDGDAIVISDARAQLRRYTDKSGAKHRKVEFLVGRVYFGSLNQKDGGDFVVPDDCEEEISS